MIIPEPLTRNPHFSRYYRTWQKNPVSVVFISLAEICREQGFLSEAQEICETGLLHNPDSVSGRLTLARVLFDQDTTDKALEIIKEILKDYPAQQEAMVLYEKIQKYQEKRARNDDFPEDGEDTLTEKNPDKKSNLWENATMAQIYADQGEARVARDMLLRILSRNPHDERAKALLAKLGVV